MKHVKCKTGSLHVMKQNVTRVRGLFYGKTRRRRVFACLRFYQGVLSKTDSPNKGFFNTYAKSNKENLHTDFIA